MLKKRNLFVLLFLIPLVASTEILVLENFENNPDRWRAGELEREILHGGSAAFRWDTNSRERVTFQFARKDWEQYPFFNIWVYSLKATGATINVVLTSENSASIGWDYYNASFKVDWQGWKVIQLSREEFQANRSPAGWHKIDEVMFSARGWGHEPVAGTVLVLDDLFLSKNVDLTQHDEYGKNLLKNPSFEQGLDKPEGWSTFQPQGKSTLTWVSGEAHSGLRSVMISAEETARASWGQRVSVKPGEVYEVSLWYKTENIKTVDRGVTVRLLFSDQHSRDNAVDPFHYLDCSLVAPEWVMAKRRVKVPEGAAYLNVQMFLWVASGKVWFDDISLVKLPPDTPLSTEPVAESLNKGPVPPTASSFLKTYKAAGDISIDGGLSDWQHVPGHEGALLGDIRFLMDVNGPYNGAKDLSALVYSQWDEENLYFAVVATDDVVNNSFEDEVWRGDALWLALKFGDNNELNSSYDFIFGFGTGNIADVKPKIVLFNRGEELLNEPTELPIAIAKTGDGYILEAAIPWEELAPKAGDKYERFAPGSGQKIGIGLALYDSDQTTSPTARQKIMSWNTRMDRYDSTQCGVLELVEKAEGTEIRVGQLKAPELLPREATTFDYVPRPVLGSPETDGVPFGLYFSREDIPALREKVKTGLAKQIWEKLYKNAESLLVTWHPEENVSQYMSLAKARDLLRKIHILGLAYVISGDPRFADLTRRTLLSTTQYGEWRDYNEHGGDRHPAALETAEMLKGVATGYDWVYNALTPQERELICQAMLDKAMFKLADFIVNPSKRWAKLNNWGEVIIGGFGVGALVLRDTYPQAQKWLDDAVAYFSEALDNYYHPDGAVDEAIRYWNYAGAYTLFLMEPLRRGGIANFYEHEGWKNTMQYAYHMRVPTAKGRSGTIAFNDCNYGEGPIAMIPVRFASYYKDPAAQYFWQLNFGEEFATNEWGELAFVLLWYDPSVEPEPPELPLSKHFKSLDWVLLRSGWEEDDLLFAFKAGLGEGHNHMDRNSFILEAYGERLAVDSGVGSYTEPLYRSWYIPTVSHNTLLFESRGQKKARAPIVQFWPASTYDYLIGDASANYDRPVEMFKRHVLYLRPSWLLLIDECTLTNEVAIQWQLHTLGSLKVQDNTIVLDRPKAELVVEVIEPQEIEYILDRGNLEGRVGASEYVRFWEKGSFNQDRGVGDENSITFGKPNLLKNGALDEGTGIPSGFGSWLASGQAEITIDDEVMFAGLGSCRIFATTLSRVNINQRVPVKQGKKMALSYYCKTENLESGDWGSVVRVQFMDQSGKPITEDHIHIVGSKGTTGWRYYEEVFEVRPGTVYLLIEPFLWNATGTVWFDELRLVELEDDEEQASKNRISEEIVTLLLPLSKGEARPSVRKECTDEGQFIQIKSKCNLDTVLISMQKEHLQVDSNVLSGKLGLIRREDDTVKTVGLHQGTKLVYEGKEYLAASRPVEVTVNYHQNTAELYVEAEHTCTLSFWSPASQKNVDLEVKAGSWQAAVTAEGKVELKPWNP